MKSSMKRSLKSRQIGLVQTYHLISGVMGLSASLVVQDLTFTANDAGVAGNSITIAFADTVSAGAETVVVTGTAVVVNIESGVSTATQVLAALAAESDFTDIASAAISGTAGDAQVTAGATSLAGGVDAVAGADNGLDRAYVSEVEVLGTGTYKITFKEPSRLDIAVAAIASATEGAIGSIAAVDEESVTVQFVTHAGVDVNADFYLSCIHSTLLNSVF